MIKSWTTADYLRAMIDAYEELGFRVVERDGEAFLQIEREDTGADVLTEINLTLVAQQFARVLL